jgi:anti-anti-sigma regulatory factor
MGQMNVGDLAILLTASRMAREDNVDVWVTGLPGQSWRVLHALGLGDEFKQFPDESEDNSA